MAAAADGVAMALPRRPVSRRIPTPVLCLSLRRVVLGVSAAAVLVLAAAAPADAVNANLGGSSFGFEPRSAAAPVGQGQLTYHGGPVMHSNNTFAIYWDPPAPTALNGNYDGDWKTLIDRFLSDVGRDSGTTGNVYAVTSQYTDGAGRAAYNSNFRGAYTDTQAYPGAGCSVGPACVTDAQVRSELGRFIAANSLPTGMSTIFFVLTPPGVTVCTDSSGTDCSSRGVPTNFCSYHSFIGNQAAPGPDTVLYAVQPWTAGAAGLGGSFKFNPDPLLLATDCQDGSTLQEEPNQIAGGPDTDGDYDAGLPDVIINEMSVEQIDTVTNPLLNGWYEDSTSAEQADECRNDFLVPSTPSTPPTANVDSGAASLNNQTINGDSYYLNDEFNLSAMTHDYPGVACLPYVNLAARFTAPTAVNAGDVVGLDADESDVSMLPASYSWDFGDGSPASTASSTSHSYTYGGTYTVTLTVTDEGGNVSGAQHQITVTGPPAPTAPGTPGSGGTGNDATGSGGAGSGGSPASPGLTGSAAKAGTALTPVTPGASPTGVTAKAPAASEQVLTHSLAKARRGGVTIGYRVDQAVAGRLQIMIDGATARRLHIAGGSRASAPVVVGSAILVTLKGGRSQLAIHFSKAAARRLRHARSLAITVKMTVASDGAKRTVVDAATTLR